MTRNLAGVRRVRAGAACGTRRARGHRRRSRRNPRADPATEGKLRSAHPGARAAPQSRRGENSTRGCDRCATAATCRATGRDSGRSGAGNRFRHHRVQSRHLGGTAGRLRESVAGPEPIRDRRVRSERRYRAGEARVQHRRVGVEPVGKCRRQVLRQSGVLALPREHRRSGGSLRPVHRGALRNRAEVRPLSLQHRLSERPAPARLGLLSMPHSSIRRSSAASTRTTGSR